MAHSTRVLPSYDPFWCATLNVRPVHLHDCFARPGHLRSLEIKPWIPTHPCCVLSVSSAPGHCAAPKTTIPLERSGRSRRRRAEVWNIMSYLLVTVAEEIVARHVSEQHMRFTGQDTLRLAKWTEWCQPRLKSHHSQMDPSSFRVIVQLSVSLCSPSGDMLQ